MDKVKIILVNGVGGQYHNFEINTKEGEIVLVNPDLADRLMKTGRFELVEEEPVEKALNSPPKNKMHKGPGKNK